MKNEEPTHLIINFDSKIVNYELELILSSFEGSPAIFYKKRSQSFFNNYGYTIESLKTVSYNFAIDWDGQRKEFNIAKENPNNFTLKEFIAPASHDFKLYNLNL